MYAQGGADQIPDINKLTEGLSPTQTVVVVIAVAVISIAVFVVPRVWPERKQPPTVPVPAASPATAGVPAGEPQQTSGGVVTDEVRASRALLDRLVSGLEQQLADELARTERLEVRYEKVVEELRQQLAAAQQDNWAMREQVSDLRRQIGELRGELENSHRHVVELQAQLRVHDDQRRYGQPGGRW